MGIRSFRVPASFYHVEKISENFRISYRKFMIIYTQYSKCKKKYLKKYLIFCRNFTDPPEILPFVGLSLGTTASEGNVIACNSLIRSPGSVRYSMAGYCYDLQPN